MAKSVFSKVDEYGFERGDDFDYEWYEEFMSEYLKVLARRARRWNELVGDVGGGDAGKLNYLKNPQLKRFIRKGIPAEHRPTVWLAVSGAESLRCNMSDDFYKNLLNEDLNPTIAETIKLDLPRTYPDNIYFKTMERHQMMLFNVLAAYAHHNPKVGYCQGLNYIAGLLLLVTKSEEATFWLLKVLVEQVLEDYYSPSMEGVIIDIEVLSRLVRDKASDAHRHIANFGLPWAVIATKWFICLFAEVLPVETVLRIWDCLFYEGSKIIFRVGLTLIKRNRRNILNCSDFSQLADCFKEMTRDSVVSNCHEFVQSLFEVPGSLSRSKIHKLRERVSKEQKAQKIVNAT